MTTAEIKALQSRVGTKPDGFWGPMSTLACQAHLARLMPKNNPWPEANETALNKFYGRPGDESKLVTLVFPYPVFFEGKLVTRTRCHAKVRDSLLRVLTEIGDRWGRDRGIMEEAEDYNGVYDNRPMRGGSLPSLHARGAAIDLDADDNGNHVPWPVRADMPIEIMEAFAREGWLSAGAFWSRDAMHHQATRLPASMMSMLLAWKEPRA